MANVGHVRMSANVACPLRPTSLPDSVSVFGFHDSHLYTAVRKDFGEVNFGEVNSPHSFFPCEKVKRFSGSEIKEINWKEKHL